ncbi:GspH/FimT family pseudopilin [Methylomonas sp. UP202]|uniref:GspH/FimT family pseudopilin n=1 Tax=Methylomonas sp. UP202 TaxID=3040943 RepID=UPI002478B070|nr:GspH/FimT family pseudopilin [Methylomonas sp. UP202]WGS87947.1 GspH/FimT family pseudopilin [Methylomonas sp. UP202]
MRNFPPSIRGFTLVELMVALTITGILGAIAIPSFVSAVRNSRLTAATNQLIGSLNFARSESIKRGQIVVVRKSSTNWEDGWQVFVDIDRSPNSHANVYNDNGDSNACEATEDCLLRIYEPLPTNFTLRGNNFSNFINFSPSGESNTNGSFAICDNSDGNGLPESNTSRLIIINSIGRIRLGKDNNNDGIPEKNDGTPLSSCIAP